MAFDFPSSPNVNDTFTDPVSGAVYRWSGTAWLGGGTAAANLIIADSPPANPADNSLWWQSSTGMLFLRYNDGNSKQWVQINSLLDGTYLKKVGVTDGSDALPGQIGEVIQANVATGVSIASGAQFNLAQINLSPGDWDISGEVWLVPTAAATILQAAIAPTSGLFPTAPAPNTSRNTLIISFPGGASPNVFPLRTCRASVNIATPYYLLAYASFATGTCTAMGNILARRVR